MKNVNGANRKSIFAANGRQRRLLTLLSSVGGHARPRDFQKILFLYCQELKSHPPYEFIPYQYGAFSFTSYADRRKLVEAGLLVEEKDWRLTEEGHNLMALHEDEFITAFVRRLEGLRGDTLVAETYRRFPYYAIRSEIADRVLCRDKMAMMRIKAARTKFFRSRALHYWIRGGEPWDGYLNTLIREGVTLLCDVRHNPISRKYGFARSTLRGRMRKNWYQISEPTRARDSFEDAQRHHSGGRLQGNVQELPT